MSQRDREDRMERVVDATERIETHKGGGFARTSIKVPEGLKLFTPKKEGTYALEIIPYDVGEGNPIKPKGSYYYERTYYGHQVPDPTSDNSNLYCCNRAVFKSRCAVCDFVADLRSQPGYNKGLVEAMKIKERQLWLVFDWDAQDRGLQLWDISFHLFGKYLDNKIKLSRPDDREIYKLFASPNFQKGSTVKATGAFKRAGDKGNPFLEFAGIELAARRNPVPKELYDHDFCLDDMPIETPYEELQEVLRGTAGTASRTTVDSGRRDQQERDPRREEPRDQRREEPRQEDRDPRREPERPREEVRREEPRREDPPRREEAPVRQEEPVRERQRDTVPPPAPAASHEMKASEKDIRIGDKVVHAQFGVCSVEHISGDETSLRIKDKQGTIHRAIAVDEVKHAPTDAAPASPPPPARTEEPRREAPRQEEAPRRRDDDPPPARQRDIDDEPPRRRRDS